MKPARHKIWGSHLRFVIYVYRSVDKIFQGGVQFAEIFTNHGHPHFKKTTPIIRLIMRVFFIL